MSGCSIMREINALTIIYSYRYYLPLSIFILPKFTMHQLINTIKAIEQLMWILSTRQSWFGISWQILRNYKFQVLDFDNNYSGLILLIGQLADGISTTLVGGLSDRPDSFILCRWRAKRQDLASKFLITESMVRRSPGTWWASSAWWSASRSSSCPASPARPRTAGRSSSTTQPSQWSFSSGGRVCRLAAIL